MAKINSKQKGKSGELEACKFLNSNVKDVTVRRTAQYSGQGLDSKADVIGLPYMHVEVKRVERLNIHEAVEQSIRDNVSEDELSMVLHRKNRTPWLVTMVAEDWLRMYEAYRRQQDDDKK